MGFWRRSARISRKDRIRYIIIKQGMDVARSLLDDIKTKQLQCYERVRRMEEWMIAKRSYEMEPGAHQEEENEVELNLPGRKGSEE